MHNAGFRKSGIYMIKYQNSIFNVYCDQEYKNGGKGDRDDFKDLLSKNTKQRIITVSHDMIWENRHDNRDSRDWHDRPNGRDGRDGRDERDERDGSGGRDGRDEHERREPMNMI